MIIDGVNYRIIYPFISEYNFSFYDVPLTSGNIRRFDYGKASDTVSGLITFLIENDELDTLVEKIQDGWTTYAFSGKEEPFSSVVAHSVIMDFELSGTPSINRVNDSYYQVSANYTAWNFTTVSDSTEPTLNFPAFYSLGDRPEYIQVGHDDGENYTIKLDRSLGRSEITLDLSRDKSQEFMGWIVNTVRANAFGLNADWLSLNLFAPDNFAHALVIAMSEQITGYNTSNLTLTLQGYNNG